MALNINTLASELAAVLTPLGGTSPDVATISNALATAIVNHIKNNAVVMPTALVAPTGGGAVTGTGTVQ